MTLGQMGVTGRLTETSLGCKLHFQLMCFLEQVQSLPFVPLNTHLSESGGREKKLEKH